MCKHKNLFMLDISINKYHTVEHSIEFSNGFGNGFSDMEHTDEFKHKKKTRFRVKLCSQMAY